MKAVALILTLCLSLNVMASTGTIQELEKSFDNYNYALTVEWDQKDTAFLEKTSYDFSMKLQDLINAGLTSEQIIQFVGNKMNDKNQFETLKQVISSHPDILTANDLAYVLEAHSKSFYAQGARWNGEAVLTGVVIGILAIGALYWMGDRIMNPGYAPCVKTKTCQ